MSTSPGAVAGSLPALVVEAARRAPDRLALVESGGRSLTWADLEQEVGRVAAGLEGGGVLAGHRVLIAVGNRVEFVTTYLAVLRVQGVAVPVNPRATVDELVAVTVDSGARVLVADPDTVVTARAVIATLEEVAAVGAAVSARRPRLVVIGATLRPGERSYDQLRLATARTAPELTDPERLAALLYTSGTSGAPRAAMLSHRALLANLAQVAAVRPPMIGEDDVVLGVIPLFHVYGLNAVLGGCLRHGATLVLADQFDSEGTLDLIAEQACTVVPVAPPVLVRWAHTDHLQERLATVRLLLSGAGRLGAETVREVESRSGVAVHQGYGLTEAAPVVTTTLRSAAPEPGSVGAPLPGVELRLVDEAGRGVTGEDTGEICVRGANLFSGYWPQGSDGPDAEGWWATGDIGFTDAAGDVHLVDRVKELVIVSGFNVYPGEVEAVVAEVPDVRAVAVIGTPDAETGEAVVAYVVVRGSDHRAVVDDVRRHVATRLARFKVPSRIEVVQALPLTPTGKVAKGRLRDLDSATRGVPQQVDR